ncbi:MAG: FAD-dependent monooxygenase [Pseudomonadota bacterium]
MTTNETQREAPTRVDILQVGAGPAGLIAALLMARRGFRVLVLDQAEPALEPEDPTADLRTTALLEPTVEALKETGAWPALSEAAAELSIMRMIDAGGRENAARAQADFDALELERPTFGYNVANTDLKRALLDQVAATDTLELRAPARIAHLSHRDRDVVAVLEDGGSVRAPLLIGADGKRSEIRERIGVAARSVRYDQKAMVFVVGHERPHGSVSTEILRRGGPFTLVPLPSAGFGDHRSSVVWMESAAEADRLSALDDAAFEQEANARSLGVLGPLRLASRRAVWPMSSMIADRFHGPRTALIAEAAHAVPPIGAQGLNMSVKDAAALADLVAEARAKGADIGAPDLLARFTRRRWPDVAARVGATAALNAAAIGAVGPVRDLRMLGLRAIHGAPPLRRLAMRLGLGA